MQEWINFLIENKTGTGLVAIATIMFGPKVMTWLGPLMAKIKQIFASAKNKMVSPSVEAKVEDLELEDQNAIRHLRDRATAFGDEALIKEIKAIDSKFFDIHAKVKNA